jgi:hypothetical protein
MPQLSDVRFAALRALGFTGSTSDMLLAWLQSTPLGGTPPAVPPNAVPDAWREALVAANTASPFASGEYQRNDWWYAYLGQQGFTGQLNDRELAFWLAQFEAATGGAYSAAFSTAFD